MPILPMLESMRHEVMRWFSERREKEKDTAGIVVSKVASAIQTLTLDRARRYRFIRASEDKYEVKSRETLQEYIVDLNAHTCRCREWKARGYPCGHALAVILGRKEDPQIYAEACFTLAAYANTYKGVITHPCDDDFGATATLAEEDSDSDSDNLVLPPNTRRPPGRPKKRRIRSQNEDEPSARRVFTCSHCKAPGHSRRTCREAI